jgi:hypothetical protein
MKQLFEKVEIHLVEFRKLFDELIYAGRDMQDRNRLGNSYMPIEMYYEDVCERYLQPIPSPEKVSDLSDEEIKNKALDIVGYDHTYQKEFTQQSAVNFIMIFAKWLRSRQSIPTREIPSDLYNKIKDILRPYLHNHLEIVSDEIIEAIKESIDNIKNSFASQPPVENTAVEPVEEKKETPDRGVVFRTVNEKSVKAQRISHRINCGLIENHGLVLTESQNSFIEAVLNAEFNKQSQPVSTKSAEAWLNNKYNTNFISPDVQMSKKYFIENMEEYHREMMREYKANPDREKVIYLRSELIQFLSECIIELPEGKDCIDLVDEYLSLKSGK